LEPGDSVEVAATNGIQRDVELGKESEYGDEYDEVRAPDTKSSLVRQLIKRAAVVFPLKNQSWYQSTVVGYCLPCCTETNMGKADTAVDEENGET
jgi:hypothetical protein